MSIEQTIADEEDLREAGRKLFAGEAEFFWAAASKDGLPPMERVEIAFAGRSNVGKSSLVNALTGRKTLARISHTPGRTQQLNFFQIGTPLTLVDMPGYGFAAAAKDKVRAWTRLIHAYLRGRASLARVYVLIDARHGIKPIDADILNLLETSAVSYQVILTKADELKAGEIDKRVEETIGLLAKRAAAFPIVLPTSTRSGLGVPELRGSIMQLLRERTTP